MTSESSSNNNLASSKLNKYWAVAVFVGVMIVLVLVGVRLFQNDSAPVSLGQAPQDFTLTTFSGKQVDTVDLRGKVILIHFWASWCNTCDKDAILLEQAWQVVQAEQPDKVVFLGVAYMDTESSSLDFLSTYGVSYPNGPDLRGEISKVYQVNTVPETFILDQGGTLRHVKFGPFSSLNEVLIAVDLVLTQGVD
jgi:cytochrome c biogenesis protein CcmG, thiol:disulfide interchange protein DsbE